MALLAAVGARGGALIASLAVAFMVAPEIFGVYGRFQAAALVFSVIGGLRLERGVVTAPDDDTALRLTVIVMGIAPVAALGGAAAIVLWLVPDLLRGPNPALVAALSCAALAGRIAVLVVQSWIARLGSPGGISAFILVQSAVQFTGQIGLLRIGADPLTALIGGEVAGQLCASVLFAVRRRDLCARLRRAPPLRERFAPYRRLPAFELPGALASQAFVALPLIAMGLHAPQEAVGHAALAWRIVDAPVNLLAGVATSFAVAGGYWRAGAAGTARARDDARYLLALAAGLAALLAAAHLAATLAGPDSRIAESAAYLPFVAPILFLIAAGGPHADLLAYAGGERAATALHLAALAAALAVAAGQPDPRILFLAAAGIALLRAAAARLLLARQLRLSAPAGDQPAQPL
jgi:hypothetical protein